MFTASTEVNIGRGAAIVVQPLPSGPRTVLHRGGYFARYVPSGHIVFVQEGALVALADPGILAYARSRQRFDARPMAWMDCDGSVRALRAEGADWNPEFSPDGLRMAIDITTDGDSDIWVYDWTKGVITRVTSEPTNEEFPAWTPDGTALVYRSYASSVDPPRRST